MLALIADKLADLAWLYVEAHKNKGTSNPRPRPLPRPGAPNDQPPLITGRQLGAWLNG